MATDLPSDSVFLDQSSSSGFLGSAAPPAAQDDLDSLQGDPWETAESTEQAELDEFEALEAATRGQSASKPPALAERPAPGGASSGPHPGSGGSISRHEQAQAHTAAIDPEGSPPRSALVRELFGGAGTRDTAAAEHGYDGADTDETRFHDGHERPDGGEYGTEDQTATQPAAVAMPATQLPRPLTSSSAASSPPGVMPSRGRGRAGVAGGSPTARQAGAGHPAERVPQGAAGAPGPGLAPVGDAARRGGAAGASSDGATNQEAALQAVVEGRVARLEEAMRRYRAEVEREAANADARDREADALRRERQGLREWRAAEQKRLDAWKEEETRKMAKDKRIAVRQARAGLASGTELKQLKAQAADLAGKLESAKVEAAARERRVKAATTQMRKQLVESRERAAELEAQLRRSEEERLRWWEEAVRLREAAARHKEEVLLRVSQVGVGAGAAGAGGTGRGSLRAEQARTVASRLRGSDWLAGDEAEQSEAALQGHQPAGFDGRAPTNTAEFEAGASPPHTGDDEWGAGERGRSVHNDRHSLEEQPRPDTSNGADGTDPVIVVSGLSLEAVAGEAEPSWAADGTDASSSRSADTNGRSRSRARADAAAVSTAAPPVVPPGVVAGSPRAGAGATLASDGDAAQAGEDRTGGRAEASTEKEVASPPPGLASASHITSTWPGAMLQAVAELALVDGDPAAPGAASRIVTGRRERGDGKWELSLEDGSRLTVFRNGTHKEARAGGVTVVRFNNGDVRQSWGDRGVVVYYYSDASTVHVTHSSGEQVFRFPSGQVERHAADGTKHIDYPDGTQKTVMPSGEQRSTFPDGTTMVELPDGSHVVSPPGRASSGK